MKTGKGKAKQLTGILLAALMVFSMASANEVILTAYAKETGAQAAEKTVFTEDTEETPPMEETDSAQDEENDPTQSEEETDASQGTEEGNNPTQPTEETDSAEETTEENDLTQSTEEMETVEDETDTSENVPETTETGEKSKPVIASSVFDTEEETVTFEKVSTSYNDTYYIYANGIPLVLKKGTGGDSYTVIYADRDGDGNVTEADIWTPEGMDGTIAGNRYDICYIYGGGNKEVLTGDTNVTMEGGRVDAIYGGGYSAAVDGNTKIIVHGGTVSSIYGAGQMAESNVTGNTEVVMDGGVVENSIFGGGYDGTVGGNTSVTVTGGTVTNHVCGGSCGTQSGTTGVISGSTSVSISGDASVLDVVGGSYYSGTVAKDTEVTISGGTIRAGTVTTSGDYFTVCGSGYEGAVEGNVTVSIIGGTVSGHVFGSSYRSAATVGGNISMTIQNAIVMGAVQATGAAAVAGGVSLTVGGTARIGTAEEAVIYNGILLNGGTVKAGIDSFKIEPDLAEGAKLYLYLPEGFECENNPVVATEGIQSDIRQMELKGQVTVPEGMGLYLDETNIYIGAPKAGEGTDVANVASGEGDDRATKTYSYGGNSEYTTAEEALLAAWSDAQSADFATVTLLTDVTDLSGALTVEEGDSITFAGEGNTLSGSISTSGMIHVTGGKLSIQSGTIQNNYSGTAYGVSVSGTGEAKITGGTFIGTTYGLAVYDSGKATVDGTAKLEGISTSGGGMCTDNSGSITMNGGIVSGSRYGVLVHGGQAIITGGEITTTGTDGRTYGIYVDADGRTEIGGNAMIRINRTGNYSYADGVYVAANGEAVISGGEIRVKTTGFTSTAYARSNGVNVYGHADITGGMLFGSIYGVQVSTDGTVDIGGSAQVGSDASGDSPAQGGLIVAGAGSVADINGGTITGGAFGVYVNNADGAVANIKGGTISGTSCGVFVAGVGTANIYDGELVGAAAAGSSMCAGINATGSANIYGGTFTASGAANNFGIYAGPGGILNIAGEDVIARVDIESGSGYGVYVTYNAHADICNGIFTAETGSGSGFGLLVSNSYTSNNITYPAGTAVLSGGTFKGSTASVYNAATGGTVKSLLAENYGYYKGETVTTADWISDETVLAQDRLTAADGYGTVTVGEVRTAAIYGATLTLDGTIGVNFYVDMADVAESGREAYTMHFMVNDAETVADFDANAYRTFGSEKAYYRFTCPVAAKQMTDTITASLYCGDTPVKTVTYSVKTYCDRMIRDTDTSGLSDLLKAMLNYGGYAQTHFGYQTGKLANDGLYGEQEDPVSNITANDLEVYACTADGEFPEGITGIRATLLLECSTAIRFYIEGDVAGYGFLINGVPYNLIENTEGGADSAASYYIELPGVTARQLEKKNTLTISDSEGQTVYTADYSALTYAYNVLSNTDIEAVKTLQDVVKALYLYSEAAKVYTGWLTD